MKNLSENDFLQTLIDLAIQEDHGQAGDITARAVIDEKRNGSFVFRARQVGVLSGTQVVDAVVRTIDKSLTLDWQKSNGNIIGSENPIATISGNLGSILRAERICLNFLSHLSGISTQTRNYVDILVASGSTSVVRDTRKTTPGYRFLEKAAVVDGGGQNHRMGLYDAFLIKDNHLDSVSIEKAIQKCREFDKNAHLEVEVDSLEQLKEVIIFKPDLVLLDNFNVRQIGEAMAIAPDTKFEVSGGVNLDNLVEYGSTNVDFIAIGALTHSVAALDIGLDAK